ncbi:hypothetical protein F751_3566 [Auxenochlorella protothecoides]|uniref:Uncharacterized protein n=1 Tax=Auxenochlorella protothecoides TaxID=3075 RepID=A0A087SSN2_AUXPR|nr:hypothetical protein F751_3566 [Auxenochlorella protothecoides]KFM28736.1 hypothetical protein F751_3566 [Auxenochlorella protothecoides]
MRLAVAEARREAQRAQRNTLLQRVDPARLGRMLAAQAPGQPGSKRARQACAAADAADRERGLVARLALDGQQGETLQRLAQGLSVDPALLAACKAPSDAPWARHLAGAGAASPSDHPLPGSSQGSGEPACSPEGPGVGVVDLLTGDPWTGQSVALR